MILDQAERLRELARAGRRRAHVVAVASGKGGVGKTNLAVNLAVAAAAGGRAVHLLDMDLGLANVDILMNLSPRHTLAHVLAGGRHLSEIVVAGPGGVRVVPGASGVPRLADLDREGREGDAGVHGRAPPKHVLGQVVMRARQAHPSRGLPAFGAAAAWPWVVGDPPRGV